MTPPSAPDPRLRLAQGAARDAGLPADGRSGRTRLRFLLYSHDGMGLGHVRRNLALADSIVSARPGSSVVLVTGTESLEAFSVPEEIDVVCLPGLRKLENSNYAPRRLAMSSREVSALRAGLIATTIEQYRPHVVLADKHPGGVQGELTPGLERLRADGGAAALGLRDVLDEPARVRHEWRPSGTAARLLAFHERVLVYGQEGLLGPFDGCDPPSRLGSRLRHCGYVVGGADPAPRPLRQRRRRLVVAMAGGGEDGIPLLRAFLAASVGASWDGLAVTGPQAPAAGVADLRRLSRGTATKVVGSVRDLGTGLGGADAVVCMGGYNSLGEVLRAAVPAVCVPRVEPRTEQLVRARAFAARGLIRVIEPSALDGPALRAGVDGALATRRDDLARRIGSAVDLNGASRAAAALVELAVGVAARRPESRGARQ